MAKEPAPAKDINRRYGPHVQYTPPGGWVKSGGPAKLVKTHCCFCGQQCGIQLKVQDNEVVGFEPWYEFPYNKGMLCPKGVKRYLQGVHPDRLTHPLLRTPDGFQPVSYDDALDFTTRRLLEIREKYGQDAIAVYGGASMVTEKAYVLGKFARVAIGTKNIDYNGRLCMVSAGVAYKLAFGIDRAPNPWADVTKTEVLLVVGANIADCAPIATSYIWQMKENGGKLIVADPRLTPITRNADLYLPVRPGTDLVLLMAMLHVIIREQLVDHEFIEATTTGWEAVRDSVEKWDPRTAAEITGVPPGNIEKAALMFASAGRAMAIHARGLEHHSKGVENCLALINLCLATGNLGGEGRGCFMITGQGNGQGGREHGQKCDQLPGARSISDPEARRYVAGVWGVREDELPGPGLTAVEIMEAIHRGEIKALLSMCFNPLVSLPDANYTREALERLEFFGVIDFFLSETAHLADVVIAGSLQEEDEGVVCSTEGRVQKINKAVDPPGEAKSDARVICDLAARLGKGHYFPYSSTHEIFEELRVASKGGIADYYGITWERVEREMGVFWPCPALDHPGTLRLFENGHFWTHDGKAHFLVTENRRERRSGRRRVSDLPDHRPRGEPVPLGRPDAAHRATRRSVSRAALRNSSAPRRPVCHQGWRLDKGNDAAQRGRVAGHGGSHHPSGYGFHSVSLAGTPQRQSAHAPHHRPAQQDP